MLTRNQKLNEQYYPNIYKFPLLDADKWKPYHPKVSTYTLEQAKTYIQSFFSDI